MTDTTETPRKREFHGILKTSGERVFMGSLPMTDEEVLEWADLIKRAYSEDLHMGLHLRGSSYDVRAFAGIQITPPPEL